MIASQMVAWSVPLIVGVLFLASCCSLIVAIRFGRFLYDSAGTVETIPSPIERAQSIQSHMSSRRLTQKEMAKLIGCSQAQLSNDLRLLQLPESLQKKVSSGVLAVSLARVLLPYIDRKDVMVDVEHWIDQALKADEPIEKTSLDRWISKAILHYRRAERSAVQRLQLTPIEREIIVAHFDQQYTDRGMWADIKLESFVEMIREGRPTESVPVFFAQRRVIREFAHEHGLLWLYDMLRTPKVTHDLAESSAKETA